MRLLAVGIIYPISDSQWVSLVQMVPKKSRMIVLRNWHDNGSRKISRKIPLLYMQIHITSMDQHKTSFTCPFGTFAYT
ncbi:hypothetical protein CR513_16314, partial [Mucuna pruriens]